MDTTTKILIFIVFIGVIGGALISTMYPVFPSADATPDYDDITVYFFYGEECPHCHAVMPFITNLTQKYPDVEFRILEVWHNSTNAEVYAALNNRLNQPSGIVPEVIVGNTILIGDVDIPNKLEGLIINQSKQRRD
jgi:thiol-disulfide isomerase/thioredoxin